MITKIQINTNTLEAIAEEPCIINCIKEEGNVIELEISIPEPEVTYPYINITP